MSNPTPKSFEEVMRLTRGVSSSAAFSDHECSALYNLCHRMVASSVVVEIGCQLGRTSSIIAQVGADIGYHSIHIDPYTYQLEYLSGWIAMMHGIGNPFTFLCMRTDQAAKELESLSLCATRPGINLLLIDGDHTTAGVEADCKVAGQLVRRGGYLLAHDYGDNSLPDVKPVIDRYTQKPVWEAVGLYDTLGVWQRC